MFVDGLPKRLKILTGDVRVLLRRDKLAKNVREAPEMLTGWIVNEICAPSPGFAPQVPAPRIDADKVDQFLAEPTRGFVWKREIPYFYCHFSERLQLSGYLRLLEEAVALFLARAGISINTMLRERRWIPFVSQAQITILREARMEEVLYTAIALDEIYKNLTFAAKVDFYVSRDGALVHTATGSITHGYGLSQKDLVMVHLDEGTMAALRGGTSRET